jgi:phospholipid/cholesterol/gamma-HCH transport system substrate-binding protein
MAQRKQLTWTELRVGLFVLVGLFILAAGIFYVTGAGVLGPKYRLKTYQADVSGLANGAPVRVDGVDVGNVESITLVPASRSTGQPPGKERNIEVDMRLDRRFQRFILTDSTSSVVTEGLLGNKYLNISRGFTGVPLTEGQEIPASETREVLNSIQALSDTMQEILNDIKEGKGSIGKLVNDPAAYNHLNSVLNRADSMMGSIQAGHGTLGKLVASNELYDKVDKSMDNINGLVSDARSGKGTIAKLLNDPALYDEAKQALNNTNAVLGDVRAGKGSLGKLATDDALYNKLRDTSSNLADASKKLNENTTTAGKLFSDPKLYDNLAGLTGDLRLLIGEFRQNPAKFLRVKVSLF